MTLLPSAGEIAHLRNLVRSNVPPSEPRALRSQIHTIFERVAKCRELSANTTDEAEQQRYLDEAEQLESYAYLCRSVLSPIRRLPPEILSQIFSLCLPNITKDLSSKDYTAEIHRLTHRELLIMGQVCAHWRAIALGTPSFWRIIDLDLMFWSHKMLPLVEESLARSANSLLHLRLGAPDNITVDSSLLKLLARHSSRWQAVLLCMDFSFSAALAEIKGNLPRLEYIHLAGLIDQDGADIALALEHATAAVSLIADAPSLVDVAYTGPVRALDALPWSQLERFEYFDVHLHELNEALSVIKHFPPGLQFDIRRLFMPHIHTTQSNPLGLPVTRHYSENLHSMIIELQSSTGLGIEEVLNRVTLPALTHLEATSIYYPATPGPLLWNQESFQAASYRSDWAKSLTSLYLFHVLLRPAELLSTLTSLPRLSVVVVADHAPNEVLLNNDVLQALVWDPDKDRTLLPNLTVFGALSLLSFDENLLLAFFRSRLEKMDTTPSLPHPVADVEGAPECEAYIRWLPETPSERLEKFKKNVLDELRELAAPGGSCRKGVVWSMEAATETELKTFFY
ncbi:F-box domain-containing protein [Mycena chlorophos]|uniref:F-box domain-containing protein n=1 Tax=Mycena chlorophos TaxID=658473 RepID=A0A8H6SBL5_MYCCL|nr:F-box domain-containing protein [Mycena chlorophos]